MMDSDSSDILTNEIPTDSGSDDNLIFCYNIDTDSDYADMDYTDSFDSDHFSV